MVIDYIPPAGTIGKWVAALFGKNPASEIREDLRRFKRRHGNRGGRHNRRPTACGTCMR